MLFVTVGTQPQLFKRLFDELTKLVDSHEIKDEIIAQVGPNKVQCDKFETIDFLPSQRMLKYIEEADLIISHGGTGSIIPALKLGKKVIGVPRLQKYGEHINDHQVELIDKLSKDGYIIPVYDIQKLGESIIKSEIFQPKKFVSGQHIIIHHINEYIMNH